MSSPSKERPFIIATRGSALALVQSRYVRARLEALIPGIRIEIEVFKTTGDQLQNRPPEQIPSSLPKGLFTKELEAALLEEKADVAVHSLKDLPTELPGGLEISAVSPREDVREVLLTRRPLESQGPDGNPLKALPDGACIGTGSPRRQAFVGLANQTLKTVPIRGNVPTRIRKLHESDTLDGIVLAAAGLRRLGYTFDETTRVTGNDIPDTIYASTLSVRTMIPCVGQGAIGLESRQNDERVQAICEHFNHPDTRACVETERAFLAAMGGGCQSPVAAYASRESDELHLLAANVADGKFRIAEGKTNFEVSPHLAEALASQLR